MRFESVSGSGFCVWPKCIRSHRFNPAIQSPEKFHFSTFNIQIKSLALRMEVSPRICGTWYWSIQFIIESSIPGLGTPLDMCNSNCDYREESSVEWYIIDIINEKIVNEIDVTKRCSISWYSLQTISYSTTLRRFDSVFSSYFKNTVNYRRDRD